MVLSGRIIKGHKSVYHKSVTDAWTQNANMCAPASATVPESAAAPNHASAHAPDFHDRLENCLLSLCRDADIPAPIWLSKNTTELARFKKTSFYAEQFAEKVNFDRFEIRITDV